jgi:PAS domain-containing protein
MTTWGEFVVPESFIDPRDLLSVLSTSSIGFAICDDHFRYRAVNRALAQMNGVPPEEHIGRACVLCLARSPKK